MQQTQPSPGIRFLRVSTSTDPRHLIDTWLIAEPFRRENYLDLAPWYRKLCAAVDTLVGRSAKFAFIGELDLRKDLDEAGLLVPILQEIGVDVSSPLVSCPVLGASVYQVVPWPGYWVLTSMHGGASAPGVRAYVLKQAAFVG